MIHIHRHWAWSLVFVSLLSSGLFGCSRKTDSGTPIDLVALGVELPVSSSTAQPVENQPTVIISPKQLLVAGDPYPVVDYSSVSAADLARAGIPARYKRSGPSDLYISPLGQELSWLAQQPPEKGGPRPVELASNDEPEAEVPDDLDRRAREIARELAKLDGDSRNGPHLIIAADRRTPYRILIEALYTAGQAGFSVFCLWVRSGQQRSTIISVPPSIGSRLTVPPSIGSQVRSRRLDLTVLVVTDGIGFKNSAGNVATGCEKMGPGITVPKRDGKHDLAAVTACAAEIKKHNPRFKEERSVSLTANPDTDFQTIVSVIDALRPHFPEINFAVAR